MCLGIGRRCGCGGGRRVGVGKQLAYAIPRGNLIGLVQKLLGLFPGTRAVLHGGIEQDRLQAPTMAIERTDEGMVRIIGKTRLATNAVRIVEEKPVIVA